MKGITFDEMTIGQSASFAKTISETDVYLFAGITGDFNPAHINEPYAEGSVFKKRIAHGMLGAGLISAVLGMYLPGPGTIYMKQDLKFLAPVYIGDTITATCTVREKIEGKNRVIIDCSVVNQEGVQVISGEAMVMLPKA